MSLVVEKVSFTEFKSEVEKNEGLVCLGCGEPHSEWISGLTEMLNNEEIAKGASEDLWKRVFLLETTGGRHDLAFMFNPKCNFHIGKMAIWRLRMGDNSWISDYLDNYANQFTYLPDGTPHP